MALYLLGAERQSSNNWDLIGYRLIHVGGNDNEVDLREDGIPEIINPHSFYHYEP